MPTWALLRFIRASDLQQTDPAMRIPRSSAKMMRTGAVPWSPAIPLNMVSCRPVVIDASTRWRWGCDVDPLPLP